jgi:hypothetical protein
VIPLFLDHYHFPVNCSISIFSLYAVLKRKNILINNFFFVFVNCEKWLREKRTELRSHNDKTVEVEVGSFRDKDFITEILHPSLMTANNFLGAK